MKDSYRIDVLPPRLPDTPAGRMELVRDLLHPVDPETGEKLPPLISTEDALALLDAYLCKDPDCEACDRHTTNPKADE